MKKNTKSSITLPNKELELVEELMATLQAKTKVEVIRRGLKLLKQSTDRNALKQAYATAAQAVATSANEELQALDHLSGEGID